MKKNSPLQKNKQFTHALGHDLKQPLGLIRAYSYYIKKNIKKSSPELIQYTDKIDEQVDTLTEMINKIVESTKLSNQTITFKKEEVNLNQLLTSLVESFKGKYPLANIQLDSEQKTYSILGDKLYLEQAFRYVLENAIIFSPTEIEIGIKVEVKNKIVVIKVSDQGLGVPLKEIRKIFEPYYQASNVKEIPVKRLGLGLYIAREIIGAHNGVLKAETGAAVGTIIVVELPLLQS